MVTEKAAQHSHSVIFTVFHVLLPSIHSRTLARKRVAVRCASKCTSRSGIWYACSCALSLPCCFLPIHHFSVVELVSVCGGDSGARGCIATPASPWIIPYFISTYIHAHIPRFDTHHNTRAHTHTHTQSHESGIPLCISIHSALPIHLHLHLSSCSPALLILLNACIDSRAQHILKLVNGVCRTHIPSIQQNLVFSFSFHWKSESFPIQSGFSCYGMRSSALLAL